MFVILCNLLAVWACATVHENVLTLLVLINFIFLITHILALKKNRSKLLSVSKKSLAKPKQNIKSILILAIVFYIILTIINYRSYFDPELNIFIYNANNKKWLPASYDPRSSINHLVLVFNLIIVAKYATGFLKPNITKKEYLISEIEKRNNKILSIIAYNAIALCLYLVIFEQFMPGYEIFSKFFSSTADGNFGPFGYGGNASCYLNACFPVVWLKAKSYKIKSKGIISILKYTPLLLITAAVFLSKSRIGIFLHFLLWAICLGVSNDKIKSAKNLKYTFWGFFFLITIAITMVGYSVLGHVDTHNKFFYSNKSNQQLSILKYKFINKFKKLDNSKATLISFRSNLNGNGNENGLSIKIDEHGFLYLHFNPSNLDKPVVFRATSILESYLEITNLELRSHAHGMNVKINGETFSFSEVNGSRTLESFKTEIVPNFCSTASSVPVGGGVQIKNLSIKVFDRNSNCLFDIDYKKPFSLEQLLFNFGDRGYLIKKTLEIFNSSKFYGIGFGAFSKVFLLNRDIDAQWDYWVHNDWLQILVELGIVGTVPVTCLMFLILKEPKKIKAIAVKKVNNTLCKISIYCILVHSIVDYCFYVYSISLIFVLIVTILFSQRHLIILQR